MWVQKGEYPSDLKKACVIPVYKKGKRQLCGNYRRISLISPFSKLFEKCILAQLDSFFSHNSLLSDKQYGLKKSVSTEMALENVYESFIANFEKDDWESVSVNFLRQIPYFTLLLKLLQIRSKKGSLKMSN